MSEWTRPAQPIRCAVELDKPLTVRRERWLLAQGDANANAIVAEVYQTAGKPYGLTGCTVMLTFVRPDNLALPPIEAEISGNTAIATLKDACYEVSGTYAATMQLRKDGAERTILWIIGDVKGKEIDGIVDPNHEIISIEDLMATAAEAQNAANAANAAASRANDGADRVEQLQIDASGLAGDSNNLGGKPPEYYLPAVNLLDNSDWRITKNIINQRGQTSYTGTCYGLDRWKLGIWGENPTVTIGNGYITLASDVTNDTGGTMRQYLPRESLIIGRAYTFAALMTSGSVILKTFIMAENLEYSEGARTDGAFSTIGGGTGSPYCQLSLEVGCSASFVWAALYEGSYTAETLPPYVPKGYAVELAECRRYYRELKYLVARPYNVSASARYYRIALDPPMRDNVNPTVNIVEPIETPLTSWTSTGAAFAVSTAAPTNFTVNATGDATGSDFVLRVDLEICSDL